MARLLGLVMLLIGGVPHDRLCGRARAYGGRSSPPGDAGLSRRSRSAANEPFYLEYLAESGSVTAPDQGWSSTVEMLPGAYEVLDSSDERIARRDRDYRARRPLFGVDDADTDDEDDTDDDDDRDTADRDTADRDAGRNADADSPSEGGDSVHFDRTQPARGEIEPGLYATDFDVSDCHYQLWHVDPKACLGPDRRGEASYPGGSWWRSMRSSPTSSSGATGAATGRAGTRSTSPCEWRPMVTTGSVT